MAKRAACGEIMPYRQNQAYDSQGFARAMRAMAGNWKGTVYRFRCKRTSKGRLPKDCHELAQATGTTGASSKRAIECRKLAAVNFGGYATEEAEKASARRPPGMAKQRC